MKNNLKSAVAFFFLFFLHGTSIGNGQQGISYNGWRYGLVKADHYRPIEEQNLIQPLLTIPLVSVSFLSVGGAKQNKNGNNI